MPIAIIGSGYVGLVVAACLAELGHEVACVDIDEEKIAALNGGETTIHEDYLPELLARYRGRSLTFTTCLAEAAYEGRLPRRPLLRRVRDAGNRPFVETIPGACGKEHGAGRHGRPDPIPDDAAWLARVRLCRCLQPRVPA